MGWDKRLFDRSASAEAETLCFRCNVCGGRAKAPLATVMREEPTCKCGSTLRQRSLVHALSLELFGASRAIPDFPSRPDIVGIDMSGATVYAKRIAKRLGYTNTFLHKAPRLNIAEPGQEWREQCDFVMSSDVFEHVVPPISRAFENTLQILKPGGIFVLTVPYTLTGDTTEHFPELYRYQVMGRNGRRILVNVTNEGKVQEFDQLVFHGGEGETLEMRVFSEAGLLRELEQTGFTEIRIHREPFLQFGIIWHQQWSLPITARRPR